MLIAMLTLVTVSQKTLIESHKVDTFPALKMLSVPVSAPLALLKSLLKLKTSSSGNDHFLMLKGDGGDLLWALLGVCYLVL
jgi:hypothetical protein